MAWIIGLVGAIAGVAGSGMQNAAAIKAGKQAKAFRDEQAIGIQRETGERVQVERDQKERIVGRATALAASGGGSVSDPTVQKIIGDLEGEGQYREMMTLYQGERQAKLMRMEGDALKQEGRDKADYYGMQGISSAIQGASSMYSSYNQNRINQVGKTPETLTVTNKTISTGVRSVVPGKTSTVTPVRGYK